METGDIAGNPSRPVALKADTFGCILLVEEAGERFVRRDTGPAPWWARWLARALAAREARMLRAVGDVRWAPHLLRWDGTHLDRGYLDGEPMHLRPPRGDVAYFRAARRLLLQLRRQGIAHNDLAKEANWLVLADGSPGIVDFQLAVAGPPRAPWLRLLAREDLRHLLKHKRTYCRERLTPTERRVLARTSWFRDAWFATGKPLYRLVTRRILRWRDNEGRGPRL